MSEVVFNFDDLQGLLISQQEIFYSFVILRKETD